MNRKEANDRNLL